MRRLFWRIFALFWVTAITIFLAIIWVITYQFESQKIPGFNTTPLDMAAENQLNNAAFQLKQNGIAGLRKWLEQINSFGPFSIFVLDNNLHDLGGQDVPKDVAAAIAISLSSKDLPKRMRMSLLTTNEGVQYPIVARFDGGIARLFHHPSLMKSIQIIIVIVLSAVASLLVAFYISFPLARIRNSARHFAQGNLNARVGVLPFGRSEEVVALATEFDHMAERIKMLIESHRRLVHDVSHEMRSPLARTRVALDLARDGTYEQLRESFVRIEREAGRLEDMLTQTLELSRLETTSPIHSEPIALDELLEDIVTNACYEGIPYNRHVEFVERIPLTLLGEPAALYSAFENVIRNALTYTANGTVVAVRLMRDPHNPRQCVITILDHGPGIAVESDLVRIFDPFYRTDVARTRKNGGTGLGLAIARRAIERHSGHIQARNVVNTGLEVIITLPLTS